MASERIITDLVACIFLTEPDGSRVLLRRRKDKDSKGNAGDMDGKYDVAASGELTGYTKAKETARQIAEDSLGVKIESENLKLIHVRHSPEEHKMRFFFWARNYEGEPRICRPEECDQLRWCFLDELPENIVLYLPKVFRYWQRGTVYSDSTDR